MSTANTAANGNISFDPDRDGVTVQWSAVDGSSGHQLAVIIPADTAGHPGKWRILAQGLGTGYIISVGPIHATLEDAKSWCLTYQDWPLLTPRVVQGQGSAQ